jgi:drug/metabolite transporter (DMT)-like permease
MTSVPRTKLLASLCGTVGILLWATETVLITFTTSIPPLQTVGLAFLFAALLSPLAWLITGDDPRAAFRQPPKVWLVMVGSLVGYHASIYYATQNAPPAAAALLQGTTPLMIVLGSAFLPGERLRWWHLLGAGLGFAGILLLIDTGGSGAADTTGAAFYLSVIGVSAALWGLYSIVSRSFGDVPSSALGVFYAASGVISLALHVGFEVWVPLSAPDWLAIVLLGFLPMGLALFLWDYGVKRGDIQALGAISYIEPFVGAALVAIVGQGTINASLAASGILVVCGALVASRGLLRNEKPTHAKQHRGEGDALESDLLDLSIHLLLRVEAEMQQAIFNGWQRTAPETDRLVERALAAWNAFDNSDHDARKMASQG